MRCSCFDGDLTRGLGTYTFGRGKEASLRSQSLRLPSCPKDPRSCLGGRIFSWSDATQVKGYGGKRPRMNKMIFKISRREEIGVHARPGAVLMRISVGIHIKIQQTHIR